MKVIVLQFDAPLLSFGATSVDQHGTIQPFPALSMMTGLIANALGWDHRDVDNLERLQERLRFAVRADRRGQALLDYQTVDLGADWMRPDRAGWTTRGRIAERKGASGEQTHQRYRHYRADSLYVVALTFAGDEEPSVDGVAEAFRKPARPLFIGRKSCLPASPLLVDVVETSSLVGELASRPRMARADRGPLAVWWSPEREPGERAPGEGEPTESQLVAITDERDWRNRIHVGRRLVRQGFVNPPEAVRV